MELEQDCLLSVSANRCNRREQISLIIISKTLEAVVCRSRFVNEKALFFNKINRCLSVYL